MSILNATINNLDTSQDIILIWNQILHKKYSINESNSNLNDNDLQVIPVKNRIKSHLINKINEQTWYLSIMPATSFFPFDLASSTGV